MRNYNHPIIADRRVHVPQRDLLPSSRLLPRNTPSMFPRTLADSHTLGLPEGFWEPVQPSAQRVYPSGVDRLHPADRLHSRFSGLSFDDNLEDDMNFSEQKIRNRRMYDEFSDDEDEVTMYRQTRNNDLKFVKPTHRHRVRHEPKERLIPIEVEHVRTIPKQTCHIDRYSDRRVPVQRKDSYVVDLDDYEDSSSENSDCDIYPFVQRHTIDMNDNAADVKTRRSRSKKRPEPYSIDLRSNTPSPETESRYRPSTSAFHNSPHRSYLSHDRDLSNFGNKGQQQKDKVTSSFCPTVYENYEPRLGRIHPSTSASTSGVQLHRCDGKINLIHQDEDSSFSTNGRYQFSDGEDECIVDENEDVTMQSSRSRQSSDSDEGITPTPSYPAYNIIRDMIRSEGRQVDYIRGDGNCFFRALSKVIYNTESCHEEIRQAVVDLMEKYPKKFEQFIDGKSIHDHIIAMRKNGTWGTQAEIYGAATLLQRDIYILSPDPSGKKYRWLLFSPRFEQTDVNSFDLCYITLCHTNGNHYDRIAPLVGKCNCALNSPQLSGVKAKVDLTDEDVLIV